MIGTGAVPVRPPIDGLDLPGVHVLHTMGDTFVLHQALKRIDIPAGALFHHMTVEGLSDLDLSYTPPFGSPWDAVQLAAQDWVRQTRSLPA